MTLYHDDLARIRRIAKDVADEAVSGALSKFVDPSSEIEDMKKTIKSLESSVKKLDSELKKIQAKPEVTKKDDKKS